MTRKHCYGPAPDVRGTVHSYWLERREKRLAKRQAASPKRQATSSKPLELFPVDMCRK